MVRVEVAVRDVPTQYQACRAWGHQWSFTTVDKVGGEYIQGMRCTRCTTVRAVRINAVTGLRLHGNSYKYPEQLDPDATPYQMPKGTGGPLTAEERGQVTLADVESRYRPAKKAVPKKA